MKRVLSLLLGLTLLCTLSLTAFAAGETFTISVPDGDTHTYSVYQIFTGDLSKGVLSNVKWGQNAANKGASVTPGSSVPPAVLDALAAVADSTSDSDKLDVIKNYVDLTSNAITTVSADSSYDAAPGYYLIKDSASLDGETDASTTYIVQIVDNVEIARKAAMPKVEKKVHDDKDSKNGAGWFDTADHNINESFQFKLTAILEADKDYAAYPSYKVVFHDTMSAGVVFESIESVTINTTAITDYTCTATTNQAGGGWTLTIEDIKDRGVDITDGATVTVIYNAHLNENAFVNKTSGTTDNKNEVYLTYSNNPYAEGEMGETTTDIVWVFTYGVDNFKYKTEGEGDSAEQKALPGAGFTLYNGKDPVHFVWNATKKAYVVAYGENTVTEMFSKDDGYFNIIGLDDGTYTLSETTTPAGYNTAPDTTVVISAEHPATAETTPSVDLNASEHMNNEIENKSGTVLPETGGIGTTIFYIAGSVLVLGAGILLITKKRMSAER